MKLNSLFWSTFLISACLTISSSLSAQPTGSAYITGMVEDEAGQALARITVWAEHDTGALFAAQTDTNGVYTIKNLPEGFYRTMLGYDFTNKVLQPECGYHEAFLMPEGALEQNFVLRGGSGVYISFGKPGGPTGPGSSTANGSGPIDFYPAYPNGSNYVFDLALDLSGSLSLSSPASRLELSGTWEAGNLNPTIGIHNLVPNQDYLVAGMQLSGNTAPSNSLSANLNLSTGYSYSNDGEIGVFTFSMTANQFISLLLTRRDLCFCGTATLVDANSNYIVDQRPLQWCGRLFAFNENDDSRLPDK